MQNLKRILHVVALASSLSIAAQGRQMLAQAAPAGAASSVPQAPLPLSERTETQNRLDIPPASKSFHLGEENLLTLTLKGPAPTHVFIMQRTVDEGSVSPWIPGGEDEVHLERSEDGAPYVKFVPLRPGKLEVRVHALYSDGEPNQASAFLDVVADRSPLKLVDQSGTGGLTSIRRMDLSEQGRRDFLRIRAVYPGVKEPLPLEAGKAEFKVLMSNQAPPIEFNQKTMEIKALRIGRALIEIRYNGLSKDACIEVLENRESYNRSDCTDLQEGGEQGAALSSKPVQAYLSQLPYSPSDNRKGRFLADERVDVLTPSQALRIGSYNPVTFDLHALSVARIECHSLSGDPCSAWQGQWSHEGLPLQQNSDGSATVNIFPMGFGKQQFTFFILFEDGGVALKKIDTEVDAGSIKPTAIGSWCSREAPEANAPVELHPPQNGREVFPGTASIVPFACYQGVRLAVPLPPKAVQYRLLSEEARPAIDLDDSTGKVTALHMGQVLVQQSFAGLKWNTCVVVELQGEPDVSNCRRMRAQSGTPLPQPKVRVRPPNLEDEIDRAGSPGGVVLGLAMANSPVRSTELPFVDAITGAKLSPSVRDRFDASSRLQVLEKGLTVELARPGKLPVRITGPEVLSVSIRQELMRNSPQHTRITFEEPAFIEERNAGRVGRNPDGTPYLHIVPLRPGTAEFHISILFADGGVATRVVRLPVKLPAGLSPQLSNALDDSTRGLNTDVTTLRLKPGNASRLLPVLSFAGHPNRFQLNPAEVQYSVKTTMPPIIRLDPKTGIITGLKAGRVLVKSHYLGAEGETCVMVLNDLAEVDSMGCQDILGRAK